MPKSSSPLEGKLLLSSPTLRDGSFDHSVILLAEHSPSDGAFGLIINHPSGQMVGDLLTAKEFAPISHVQVHIGGPVSKGHMTFAAFWEEDSYLRFATRISAEQAMGHTQNSGALVRAFVGYTGWSKDQLEDEVESDSWFVVPMPDSILSLNHDRELWKTILAGLSPFHKILAGAPGNILAN